MTDKLADYGYRHGRRVQAKTNRRRLDKAEASGSTYRWEDGGRSPWRRHGSSNWSRNRRPNEP